MVVGLILLFVLGCMSLYVGKSFNDKQHYDIAQTAQAQKEDIARQLEYVDGHIGLLLYYIRFGIANESPELAGLSLGHRDIRLAAQLVNIRNLEEQKNGNELVNPLYQLLGNLDFSFVLIYLFPLIIIALNFNLLSEEKESGRWSLLAIQSQNPRNVIRTKLLIRLTLVWLLLSSLLLLSVIYMNISPNQDFFAFYMISLLYFIFWFSLSWWLISLDKSLSQNAIILLSFWLLLIIISPAVTNNVVTYLYPIEEAYETTIDSRDGYHNKWDEDKATTIDKFKNHYPQFSKYNHPEGTDFGWLWYYAMQQMGDDEAEASRQAMKRKLTMRNKITRWIGYLVPSIHTQLSMNALSKTDMQNYLNYTDALESFHEKLRLSYYPIIFENESIEDQDWDNIDLVYFKDERSTNWFSLLPPILLSMLCLLLAKLN